MRTWLLGHLRVAQQTYKVIETLAKEREKIELGLGIAVALPPLTRVLLESVFSVTYVFENPSTRLPDFWKGAWAKIAEQYEQYLADHGNDATWQPTLAGLLQERDGWRDDLAKQGTPLTSDELADWRKVRWPNPGKMVRRLTDVWRKDVLGYLDARYYGPLSTAAHLSGTGMLAQTGHLLPGVSEENQRIYFSRQFAISFTMYIALVSQLALDVLSEGAFARRVVGLWTYSDMPDCTREVYSYCYQKNLEDLAAR